ncbi:MAG: hypothetical protein NTV87_00570 [Ignavibacteriae bacterium]|nr:hypothetical protein [Ignavibacteriota bacterium]
MKKFSAILIIIVSLTLNSCGIFRITVSNVENTLFNSPQKVVNKVKNPVQDGVKLSALWIGHSSMLVQIYDKVILLDPFLTNTMGGIFTRRKEAGLDLKKRPGLIYKIYRNLTWCLYLTRTWIILVSGVWT